MLRTIFRHWGKFETASSFVGWMWWLFQVITGLSAAAVMAWLASHWDYFWQTVGWFGVAGVGLVSWFLIGLGLNFYRNLGTPKAVPSKDRRSSKSYLKDVQIFAASEAPAKNPRFTARFTRNGNRCRLFIDNSHYAGGLGWSGWTQRRRILIGEVTDFVAEQMIDVPLIVPFEREGQKLWLWGAAGDPEESGKVFAAHSWHRGRVVTIIDDAPPEHFYFIADRAGAEHPPDIIGYDRFSFISQWESGNEDRDRNSE